MDIWNILEIEPTTEASIIKKAYAKKLKIFHPEDDPEGYQKLREAFDSALKYAKNNKVQYTEESNVSEQNEIFKGNNVLEQNEHTEENKLIEQNESIQENDDNLSSKKFRKLKIIEESHLNRNDDLSNKKFHKLKIIEEYHYNESNDVSYSNDFTKSKQLIDQLFEDLTDLYKDFFKRIEIKNWQEALNAEIMWHLDYREDISRKMISFLNEHRHIPQNIFQFLNDDFHWTENEEKLKSYSKSDFSSYFYNQINGQSGNRYCYFRKDIQIDYDKYLDYRDIAASLLMQNKIYKVWDYLEPAYNMYKYDPDLLCMIGEYYLNKEDGWTKLIWAFNAASELNEEDMDTKIYQVEIFSKAKKMKQAIKFYKNLLRNKHNDFNVRAAIGLCYCNNKKWIKANKIFLKNLRIKPDDMFTRKELYIIAKQLKLLHQKYPLSILINKNLKETNLALSENSHIQKKGFKFSHIVKTLKVTFKILFILFTSILGIVMIIKIHSKAILPALVVITLPFRIFRKKQ